MVGATLGVAIFGALCGAGGQQATAGPDFLLGMRIAMTDSGVAEMLGALVAFALIRHDSMKAKA